MPIDSYRFLVFDDVAVPNGVDVTGVAALPGGASLAIASEAVQGRSLVVKLDRHGGYVWARRLALEKLARRVRALPDGTAVVGASVGYLARLGGGGEVLWSSDVVVARPDSPFGRCALRDVVPLEQAPGVYDYVVVGTMGQATTTGSDDGCAYRVRADGEVSWARVYAADGLQQLNGATATRDGGIGVAGEADGQLAGGRRFPLFGKLDAATGDVRWWRALPVLRTARLNSLAGENQLWVTKLPFTGSVEFLPEAGVTTRYLATGLRHSSGDERVTPGEGSVAVELPALEGVVLSSAPNPGVFAAGTTYCTVLLTRSGSASTLDACPGVP